VLFSVWTGEEEGRTNTPSQIEAALEQFKNVPSFEGTSDAVKNHLR